MSVSEKFSLKVGEFVKKNIPEKTEDEIEIIQYGIEVIVMNILKLPIILGTAYLFGILKYTIYAIILFTFIRRYSAGIHAETWWTCLAVTMTFLYSLVFVSLKFQMPLMVKNIIFLISIIIYAKYSPADTEERPLLNIEIRKRLKIKTVIVITIYFIFSISVKDIFLSNAFIHVLWMQAVCIHPATYKIFNRRYNNYEYYNEYF